MSSLSRLERLTLYKRILKNAKIFPSIKRDKIYQEIRVEFRQNAILQDEKKIEQCWKVALTSLRQLEQYTKLDLKSQNLKVTMEQEPLPKRNS